MGDEGARIEKKGTSRQRIKNFFKGRVVIALFVSKLL